MTAFLEIASILGWLVLSCLVANLAFQRGRNAAGFFVLSLLLSPLVGFLVVLAIGPNPAVLEERRLRDGEMRRCPFCAELVREQAAVCRHCGRDLARGDRVAGGVVLHEGWQDD